MDDRMTDILDIYVQRELGALLRERLEDDQASGLSRPLASLLNELRDVDARSPERERR